MAAKASIASESCGDIDMQLGDVRAAMIAVMLIIADSAWLSCFNRSR